MKKKILLLALALVMVAAAVVCVSCAKKEDELVKGKVNYTIVNNTGKKVTDISLADTRGENKVDSKAGEGGLPDGDSVALEFEAMLQNNAPDVMFTFVVEGGDSVTAHVMQATGTITMKLDEEGRPTFEVK